MQRSSSLDEWCRVLFDVKTGSQIGGTAVFEGGTAWSSHADAGMRDILTGERLDGKKAWWVEPRRRCGLNARWSKVWDGAAVGCASNWVKSLATSLRTADVDQTGIMR